jgi:glycosyltransferase involved in cell wall biosynthesis
MFEHAPFVEEALRSLLAQSRADLAVVVVDDCSDDGSAEIARALAAEDDRLTYVRNERRLGMILNWRRAYELARERYPHASYFAWGSDHDRWHPEWLERLVAALEERPQAVVAYPLSARLTAAGEERRRSSPPTFSTRDIRSPARRFAATVVVSPGGSFVYGLYRADVVAEAGVFRRVLAPDRLLLAELALRGEALFVPELLWWRRFQHDVTAVRQRRAFFPGSRAPLWSFAPWWLQHAVALARAGHGAATLGYPALAAARAGRILWRRARKPLKRARRRLHRARGRGD